jgi:amidase
MATPAPMKRLARELAYEYAMILKEPKLVVRPGEVFQVETEDANNGLIQTEDQLPIPEFLEPYLSRGDWNPCAGPIYIDGAKSGDALIVHIHDINVARQGVSCIVAGAGLLADSAKYPDCRGPYTKIIGHLPGPSGTMSDGKGVFDGSTTWNLSPHIGTIGTAPRKPIAAGADTVFGQGPHGGNMDSRDIAIGSHVMLPIAHEGAYLYLGDVHGSQADGELYGQADETRAAVTLSCELVAQKTIPWVRVETAEAII